MTSYFFELKDIRKRMGGCKDQQNRQDDSFDNFQWIIQFDQENEVFFILIDPVVGEYNMIL